MLGVAIAGLLAAFMAGMAANISAFNTVFSYDLWQKYVMKDRPDDYYLRVGRWATVGATVIAIGTALIASDYTNLMDYLQTLFGFFNAPLFATFILGMFWKRMTATAGWTGLVSRHPRRGRRRVPERGRARRAVARRDPARRPGRQLRRRRRGVRRRHRGQRRWSRLVTAPKPEAELRRAGLLPDAQGAAHRPGGVPAAVVPVADEAGRHLAGHGHHPQRHLPLSQETCPMSTAGAARAARGDGPAEARRRGVRRPQRHRRPDRLLRRRPGRRGPRRQQRRALEKTGGSTPTCGSASPCRVRAVVRPLVPAAADRGRRPRRPGTTRPRRRPH